MSTGMSEQGVPSEMLITEHMAVTADLVRLVKSANAALVWTLIEFRCRHVAYAEPHEDRMWWQVSARDLAPQVGISEDAAARALAKLVEGGYLLAKQFAFPMQTLSYSPVVIHSAESRIGERDIAESKTRNRGLHSAKSRIAPLYQEQEEVEEVSTTTISTTPSSSDLFEAAWKHWPRKDNKKKASEKFARLSNQMDVARAIAEHGDAHAKYSGAFVPHLITWLNGERWNDPLPAPRQGDAPKRTTIDIARSVDARLRAEEESTLQAVGS